jgi:serine/threonine-protein kinase
MLRPLFSGPSEIEVLMRIRDGNLGVLDRAGPRVPDDIREILIRALAKDRALRYPTAAAFAEAIEEVLRRRRLQVGPGKLAAWIEKLGLVHAGGDEGAPSETGTRQTANLKAPASSPTSEGGTPRKPPPSTNTPEPRDVAPAIYRAKMPGGQPTGPLTFPRLVELFVTGGIDHRVLVSRESGAFRDAGSYPELSRFVSSPALRWDDNAFTTQNGVAPIDRVLLPTRLFRLALERDTGALYFRDGDKKKKVYLVEGVPEFVVSTNKRELFGEHLVARGQVLRMEVEMALAMLPRFGGRLGDALCGLGVLRPIELFRAIQQQMHDRYVELFHWRKGEIAFVKGARSHEETFPLGFDPFDLVLRGVRDAYTSEELDAILSPLDEDVIEPVRPLPVRIEAFRFPEAEEQVLKVIDKPYPLGEIVKKARRYATKEETFRALFCGLSCDLLRSTRWKDFTAVPTLGA